MTKIDILKTIDTYNTNKDIKWSVVSNTRTKIILKNSYDNAVRYSINICLEEHGDDCIVVKNDHLGSTVTCLLQGHDRWSDYVHTDEGIELAIGKAVCHFNYYY